jgi:hypothetical protein
MRRRSTWQSLRPLAHLPHILVALALLTTLLLSACSSSASSKQAPLPSATPTPAAVAANKGGFADSPPIPANAANCAATSEFRSAAAASSGGLGFADVPYPAQSVAYQAGSTTNLYGFLKMRVCTNGATADSVLRALLSDLPAKGWQASKTYPYNEDSTSACGDPYCWRKAAAGDVRYVSLESMSAATGAVAFTLRFAAAPQPSASLAIHSDARTTYAAFGTLSVSASCRAGEQMVSGGYYVISADHSYSPYANYPSAPNTWTVSVKAAGSASYTLQTFVGCLKANYPLATKIVTASVDVAKGASQTATASCPAGGIVTGGGFSFSAPVGLASTTAPVPGLGGWTVGATGSGDALKATTYALCATRNLAAAPESKLQFNIFNQNDSGQQSVACKSGDQWLLGGGYSVNDDSANGKIAYELNAATADYSRWFVQGRNVDPASPHSVTLWGVCVTPAPYF